MKAPGKQAGKLRIGDDWNVITIIALSQTNPLKAVAEFVENSIDAHARYITITRGKEKGCHYLRVKDDGEGIPRNAEGVPDFHYVATHIGDSLKRRLKAQGAQGIQGEFGIGLLSFWTLGEDLLITSPGSDGRAYQMHLTKGDPGYRITQKAVLFPEPGTELVIRRMHAVTRQFSGEKIQWYLASELRDRIRRSGVQIRVIDRTGRAEFKVEPRQFEGRLLHHLHQALPTAKDLYLELYLAEHNPENRVGLYRSGTRVLDDLAGIDPLRKAPWTSGYLQGVVDAPYLELTPGSRLGVVHDQSLYRLLAELEPVETELLRIIDQTKKAEEERASREVYRAIQNALQEALLALPAEEYDWFNIRSQRSRPHPADGLKSANTADALVLRESPLGESAPEEPPQLQFFDHPGPLFSVRISPASCVVPVHGKRNFRALPRDRSRRLVEHDLTFAWRLAEGSGQLSNPLGEIVTLRAPGEPGLVRLELTARQGDIICQAEAIVTVTDSLLPEGSSPDKTSRGIPGYTLENAPGRLWRSRFDVVQNVIVINSGHRDFLFASRSKALKLRYLCRLYAKELVLRNFVGIPHDQLLERMIELTLYTEENLKSAGGMR